MSWRFKKDAQDHLKQLESAMPNAKHWIQKTNRDKDFPYEIVTRHRGKKYYSGSPIKDSSVLKRIKNILKRK